MPGRPTEAEILSARNTKAQLAQWGVPWPPPQGWRKRLLREARRQNVKPWLASGVRTPDNSPGSGHQWAPTRLPFRATITASGRSYEVEVQESGMRFVRRLERSTKTQGA
jgi:hypothetical protein